MNKYIRLSQSELFVCQEIGKMRYDAARNANVKDVQIGQQGKHQIDVDGMVGEYIVAKGLNVCPDFVVGARSGGHDLLSHKGSTIDVKATRYKTGRLLATLKKKNEGSKIYVLTIIDDFGGSINGWAKKEELFQEKNIVDLGHGKGYALSQQDLNPFNFINSENND